MMLLQLRILKNVSQIAQQEAINKMDRVSNAIEHALNAMVAKTMIVINVLMDLYKMNLLQLRILKNVS